ncbi:hypothetical protein ACT3UD_15375 [Glutamicibacter sp. 287]|uniref:hypothetical protein n=1 Tax=unclassified Glutamicibacter TaxID=2627139 RepID=UPI000BB6FC6C|nr:hypothetical protein [Glutamicibacter sp. BW80]PCC28724.1 hypothetical protein CIK76_08310 [Glutamicibacter sp. BW80]
MNDWMIVFGNDAPPAAGYDWTRIQAATRSMLAVQAHLQRASQGNAELAESELADAQQSIAEFENSILEALDNGVAVSPIADYTNLSQAAVTRLRDTGTLTGA